MTPIELTQGHKDKLLEMAKKLFPEYERIKFGRKIGEDTGGDVFSSDISLLGDDWIDIHWFEFCMTWLVDKIYYPNNVSQRNTRQKLEYFFFQTFIDSVEGVNSGYTHPVDYLYNQFQKLD